MNDSGLTMRTGSGVAYTKDMTKFHPGRRLGYFSISLGLIDSDYQGCLAALAGCVVVHAEMTFASNAIQYTALHPGFDLVPVGVVPSTYEGLMTKHPDGSVTREWRKTTEIWR